MSFGLFGPTPGTRATDFVRFDKATGDIVRFGTMTELDLMNLIATDDSYVRGAGSMKRHYVDIATREIHEKQQFPGSISGTTLSNLPVPCTLFVGLAVQTISDVARLYDENGTYECTDGTAEMIFPSPGKYVIDVKSTKYVDATFTVVV